MLGYFRENKKSWPMLIIVGLLVVGFAIYGSPNVFGASGPANAVGAVGQTLITKADFRRIVENFQAEQADAGNAMTNEELYNQGGHTPLLNSLIQSTTYEADAKRLEVMAADTVLYEFLLKQPRLTDELTGELDEISFQRIAQENRMNTRQFRQVLKRDFTRDQIIKSVGAAIQAPESYGALLYDFSNERRTLSYVDLTADDVETPEDPGDMVLQGYLNENQNRYTVPEYRKISLIYVTRDQLVPTVEVTEEEIRAQFDYEVAAGRLGTTETRDIVQLSAADQDTAAAIAARLNDGSEIDAVIAEFNLDDPITYSNAIPAQIVEPDVATAVFALEDPGFVVVDGFEGWNIAGVTVINPATTPSIDDERDRISGELVQSKAEQDLYNKARIIQDGISKGATLESAADEAGVSVAGYDFHNQVGATQHNDVYMTINQVPEISAQSFQEVIGFPSDFTEIDDGTAYFSVRVDEVIEARPKPLDEVRDDVLADWTRAEIKTRQTARLEEIRSLLADGKTLTETAEELGLSNSVETLTLTRGDRNEALSPTLVYSAFEARKGTPVSSETNDRQNWSIGVVEDIQASQEGLAGGVTQTFQVQATEQLSNDIRAAYTSWIQEDLGVNTYEKNITDSLGFVPEQ